MQQLVGTPVRFACLKSGECAGVPLGQPADIAAVKDGFRRLGDTTEAVGNFQFQLIVAHRKWAAANPDKVVPFVRAVADAFRFIRDPENRDETIKLMMEQTGSSEEIARAVMALYFEPDRGVMPRQAEIDLKGLAQVIAFMGEAGELPAPLPPVERFVDLQFLKAAGVQDSVGRLLLRRLRRVPQRVHLGASVDCAGVLPRAASALSIDAKRRSNFWLVARSVASGSASRWRARLATANSRSPTSAAAASRLPFLMSASISSASSRIFASTASGSFQSKPTLPAFCCSFSARVRAGRPTGTPASAPLARRARASPPSPRS